MVRYDDVNMDSDVSSISMSINNRLLAQLLSIQQLPTQSRFKSHSSTRVRRKRQLRFPLRTKVCLEAFPIKASGKLETTKKQNELQSRRVFSMTVATACRHSGSDATREAPAVIAIRINWQLARAGPGRMG